MCFFVGDSGLPFALTSAHISVAHAASPTSVFQAARAIRDLTLHCRHDKFRFAWLSAVDIIARIAMPLIRYAAHVG